MILRRLADSIRKQDWFTVVLEVLVVVVGIFIGLQVDDWNEARKERQLERAVLMEVRTDIQENIDRIAGNVELDLTTITACERVIANVESQAGWSDELSQDMSLCSQWSSPFITSASYESLKTRGTQLISTDSVRRAIIGLYEDSFNFLVNDTDKSLWNYQASVLMPVMNRFLRSYKDETFEPVDYAGLLAAPEFLNMLYGKKFNANISIGFQRNTLDKARDVLALLDQEMSVN